MKKPIPKKMILCILKCKVCQKVCGDLRCEEGSAAAEEVYAKYTSMCDEHAK